MILGTLEPYRAEIEHHFRLQQQQRFRGLTGAYLKLTTRIRYAGVSLGGRIPALGKSGSVETPAGWNVAAFAHECTRQAGERVLTSAAARWSTGCSSRPTARGCR